MFLNSQENSRIRQVRILAYKKTLLHVFFLWILKFLEKLFCKMRVYNYCTQLTFTCPMTTIETLEKLWNMFKVNDKNTRTTSTLEKVVKYVQS